MTLPLTMAAFEGDWHLTRRIDDALASRTLTGTGEARCRADGPGLVYDEALMLVLPGQADPVRATRRYLWYPAPGMVEIRFADGRFFHSLPLGRDTVCAGHDCAPDRYDVAYEFGDWPNWSARWQVQGPRKSYVMQTWYRRPENRT